MEPFVHLVFLPADHHGMFSAYYLTLCLPTLRNCFATGFVLLVSPHRTGLKLVEYGEEEEESSENAESPHSSNGITSPSFFPGKPFWAA